MSRPSWLAGAWDWHCHTAPCQLPRWGNATSVAREAAAAGFGGIVLQTHVEATTGRAAAAAEAVPGLSVLGGITLNESASGGLNAKAVRGQVACGASFVWMPTFDAAAHIAALGGPGRSLSGVYDARDTTVGITLVTRHGRLSPEARDVLDAVAGHPVFVGTGHLALNEVTVLVEAASARQIRTVINHPYFLMRPEPCWWRDLPDDSIVEFAAIADVANTMVPPIHRVLEVIDLLGPDRCAIGSETKTVNPIDAIVTFAQKLLSHGLDEERLRAMLTHSPLSHLAYDTPSRSGLTGTPRELTA